MSAAPVGGDTGLLGYDVATVLWQGKRPYQEDTLLADFHGGMDCGFAVLADGMGGHAAGDLASRLVVIDAVSHLKFLIHDAASLEKNLQSELESAVDTANDVLRDRAADDSRLAGMGATFLATVMFEDRLYWASVGDSPLYLWRDGALKQLNEDHSMAPVIDQMAKSGEISAEEAASHPDRNALTSVLMGGKIKSKDVPNTATVLKPGDVVIQASDGLQYLDDGEIAKLLEGAGAASSRQIADTLMGALHKLDDPAQDNTAILVLQLTRSTDAVPQRPSSDTKRTTASAERAVTAGATAVGGAATAKAELAAPETDALAEEDAVRDRKAARRAAATDLPGPRRWILPAALLGGAAVALGLFFGLPGNDDITGDAGAVPPVDAPADGSNAGETATEETTRAPDASAQTDQVDAAEATEAADPEAPAVQPAEAPGAPLESNADTEVAPAADPAIAPGQAPAPQQPAAPSTLPDTDAEPSEKPLPGVGQVEEEFGALPQGSPAQSPLNAPAPPPQPFVTNPAQSGTGPGGAAPILPPFASNVHRLCIQHRCFYVRVHP